MREYIADRRQAPLLLTGSWILIGKSDDGKKIEKPRPGVYPNQLREGQCQLEGQVEPRFGVGYLTPAAARLAPHGNFAQVRALRRTGCESPKIERGHGESAKQRVAHD